MSCRHTAEKPSESRKIRLSRRHFLWFVAAAVAIGVGLRLCVAFELFAANGGVNNMRSPSEVTDMATYIKLADEVRTGTFDGPFYYQPFYYAVFLPLIRMPGGGLWTVVLVQIALGGATVWLAGMIGEKIVGRVGGILAAWLTALSPALLLYAPFHLNETLQAFNLTLLFYLVLIAVKRRRWYWWAVCGSVAGIATLTRGNVILLTIPLALLGLYRAVREKERRRQIAGYAAAFAGALLLVELPFIWHNTRVTGRLCGPSTASGEVLALGNTPEAPPGGRDPGLPAGPMEYPESWHRMMRQQERGVSVPRQMWDWFRAQPGAFLELQFRKALLFWDGREIPNNVSLYGEGAYSIVLTYLDWNGINILIILSIAGSLLLLDRVRHREADVWLLYGFVVIYWLSIALFYDLSRFRAPILPLAAVMAGGVPNYLLRGKLTSRRRLFAMAAVLFGVFVSFSAYEFYRGNCESAVMRAVRPGGTRVVDRTGESWVFDHGPRTFGGWKEVFLDSDVKIEKRFAGVAGAGKMRLKVFAARSGDLVTDAGGFKLAVGENDVDIPVVPDAEGWFRLSIEDAPPGTFLALDLQRDYGRTRIGGEKVPGELVARLSPVL